MIDLQNESWMDDAKENRSGQIPVFYQQLTVRKHAGLIGSQGTAGNVTAAGQQRASVVHVQDVHVCGTYGSLPFHFFALCVKDSN